MRPLSSSTALWTLWLLVSSSSRVDAGSAASAMASGIVTIKGSDQSFFGSTAYDKDWGAPLPKQKLDSGEERLFYPLVYTTASLTDPFGCTPRSTLENATTSSSFSVPPAGSFILLVDRGHCTFTEKALYAQQLGAAALIVTDTLQQVYNRSQASGVTTEQREMEFDCRNGKGDARKGVDLKAFTDPAWVNAVSVAKCTTNPSCESNLCIPTGKDRRVCCAWDLPDAMGFSSSDAVPSGDAISIPVLRIKIADGTTLKEQLPNATHPDELLVTIYERATPIMDPSQFLIWLLAIATTMMGGYKGAAIERERALRKQSLANDPNAAAAVAAATTTRSPRAVLAASTATSQDAPHTTAESVVTGTTYQAETDQMDVYEDHEEDNETLDLTAWHALGFVFFATVFLLVLFYWNIVIVVIIFFALGSVSSTYAILWQPLFARVHGLRTRPFEKRTFSEFVLTNLGPDLWSYGDILAMIWSLAVVVLWFCYRNRQLAWILQDTFGICLCILFLRTIRLPNLKIATFMLVLVFLYDIFMVFISPYIFKESVMIKAATGGSQAAPTVGDAYCVRYPRDTEHNCLREQMPILLRFPKVIDWRDGQSMLGLGDIVLPGLLVVFCARFDYATRGQLMGRVKPHLARRFKPQNNNNLEAGEMPVELTHQGVVDAPRRGLFGIIMWGYAIGLLLANVGVTLMKQGQPALMYIVPTTLGTLVIVAWRRGILKKLWDGPEEFKPMSVGGRGHGHVAPIGAGGASGDVGVERRRTLSFEQSLGGTNSVHGGGGVVFMGDTTTPQSTYSRPEDTPKHATLRSRASSSSGSSSPPDAR